MVTIDATVIYQLKHNAEKELKKTEKRIWEILKIANEFFPYWHDDAVFKQMPDIPYIEMQYEFRGLLLDYQHLKAKIDAYWKIIEKEHLYCDATLWEEETRNAERREAANGYKSGKDG